MLQILKLAAKRERRRAVPFHHVCMYSALADAEFFCGRTDGGTVFNNIGGELTGALLNVSFQTATLPARFLHWKIYMRKECGALPGFFFCFGFTFCGGWCFFLGSLCVSLPGPAFFGGWCLFLVTLCYLFSGPASGGVLSSDGK